MATQKKSYSIRLSEGGAFLLETYKARLGIDNQAVIEVLLRQAAERDGIQILKAEPAPPKKSSKPTAKPAGK